jgi:hypothetical protein
VPAGARVRDGASASWRPELRRTRPSLAGARGTTCGRLVHDPGRLWPWPRRPGPWGVEEGSRGVMGVRRVRDGRGTSSRRAWEVHASVRVVQQSRTRCVNRGPYRGPKTRSAIPGPVPRPRKGTRDARKRDVPGISVTGWAGCGSSRTSASRKSDLVPAFLHTCGTSPSRASRWRPQPARVAIETPGTHLGRPHWPRTPPSRPNTAVPPVRRGPSPYSRPATPFTPRDLPIVRRAFD